MDEFSIADIAWVLETGRQHGHFSRKWMEALKQGLYDFAHDDENTGAGGEACQCATELLNAVFQAPSVTTPFRPREKQVVSTTTD